MTIVQSIKSKALKELPENQNLVIGKADTDSADK